jgi:thiol:disulfide interchange protein
MNNTKTMKWVGTVVFLTFAIFNVITMLTFANSDYPFGPEVAGPYSIFSSEKFFLAYHIWGILVAIMATYAMWTEAKMLFWISLLLLILLMFYPYFTSSPIDKAQGKAQVEREKARQDSIDRLTQPLQMDSTRQDSMH